MPERQEEPKPLMPKRWACGVLDSRLVSRGKAVCTSEAPERDAGFLWVGARDMIRLALWENDMALVWKGRRGREQGWSSDAGSEVSRSVSARFQRVSEQCPFTHFSPTLLERDRSVH